MSFPSNPNYSKSKVNKAGKYLVKFSQDSKKYNDALEIINNWRMAHAYPINTIGSNLTKKVKNLKDPIVAQRLKRLPTIIDKLKRQPTMSLSRMQDIGGVRAIVEDIHEVNKLKKSYLESKTFSHKLIGTNDYLLKPKKSGYRGIHLVYQFNNPNSKNKTESTYDGMLIEIQLRSQLQHAWATAVETMGTFLENDLKSSKGNKNWLNFFSVTSSVFAYIEKTPAIPQYSHLTILEVIEELTKIEKKYKFIEQIEAYSAAANIIESREISGSFHLITLNYEKKKVQIKSYKQNQLAQASTDLTLKEKERLKGGKINTVLVSTRYIKSLKKAYPNYFLDIREFIEKIEIIAKEGKIS